MSFTHLKTASLICFLAFISVIAVSCTAKTTATKGESGYSDGPIVVAVFEIQPKGIKLTDEEREILSSYLSSSIASGSGFKVVPPEDLRILMRRKKVRSTGDWYDKSTQYKIGREVAASKMLICHVLKIGESCSVTVDIYDLESQTTDLTEKVDGSCTMKGIKQSLDQVSALVLSRFGKIDETKPLKVPVIKVPAGEFMMGSKESEGEADERPQSKIKLDAFEIEKHEVTVEQYNRCLKAGVCNPPGMKEGCAFGSTGKQNYPVNCVTWKQAKKYCEWAGKRLCTEAEWEMACRGTEGRRYPWGDEQASCNYAVMNEGEQGDMVGWGCKSGQVAPVGSKQTGSSPFGVQDMAGNVWELVADGYRAKLYRECVEVDKKWFGPPHATWAMENKRIFEQNCKKNRQVRAEYSWWSGWDMVVRRGGGFDSTADSLRCANRGNVKVSTKKPNIGFRCCRTPR